MASCQDSGCANAARNQERDAYWISCLAELRTEFEYAVIHGPAAGISSEAAVLGQLADGIILVLGAHSTRRATARKIKETLEAAQVSNFGNGVERENVSGAGADLSPAVAGL